VQCSFYEYINPPLTAKEKAALKMESDDDFSDGEKELIEKYMKTNVRDADPEEGGAGAKGSSQK
jgi:hypothetical protein